MLGVFCRGTDYTQLKHVRHPIQPTREMLIEMVKERLNKWDCDRIFLTTEEQETVDVLSESFPEIVITDKQILVEKYSIKEGLLIEDYKSAHGSNCYDSGLGYLASVVMLSQCDFFGSNCGRLFGSAYYE